MDRETAKRFALDHLNPSQGVACAIVDLHAVETRSYWFFVWNTKEAVATSGRKGTLVGIGPVAVEKATGTAQVLPRQTGGILGGSIEPLLPCFAPVTTLDEARARAQTYVDVGWEHLTTVRDLCSRPYGWVFTAMSDEFIRTGDYRSQLVGAGPLIVEASTGTVHVLGSAYPLAETLAKFEMEHGYVG